MTSKAYQVTPLQDISQLISSLFNSAGDNIEPANIPNGILAGKEVSNLITNFKESKDWDEQLSVVQHTIAFVKGNACNYSDFTSQLPQLISQISVCIKSARTTLVKYSCLLISLLAKTLKDRFDSIIDIVFSLLYQTSSCGTQIVSISCKYAIFSIVHNVPTKRVLLLTLKQSSSSSPLEKAIASESIKFIVNEWHRNSLFPYIKQIEKSIYDLLSDSNNDVKSNAKLSAAQLMKLYPDRNSVLYPITNSNDFKVDTNSSKDDEVLTKKASSYAKDYSNTISFSYNIPQKETKPEKQNQNIKSNNESNLKSSINKSDSNDKNFISNIPRKKRSAYLSSDYKLPEQNSYNEAHTMTFTFDPESFSSQSSISEIQKLTNEAQTISFSFDPVAKGSSFYSKERSQQNSNLSVHFIRPNQNNSYPANKESEKETEEKIIQNSDNSYLNNQLDQTQDKPNSLNIDGANKAMTNTDDSSLSSKENQNPGTRIEVSSPNYFSTSLISFQLKKFECDAEKENQEKFLDSIRTTIATKQTIFISDNADSISAGFLMCLQSPNDSIQVSALNLLVDVIDIIPKSFESNLDILIKIILEKADRSNQKTSMNATTALRAISNQYPAEKLILIAAQCPETDSLLSFIANLIRNDENLLSNDQIASTILPICCKIYEITKEQRFSALSVGLLNKVSEKNPKIFSIFANSVNDQWFRLLKSLYLDPASTSVSSSYNNNSIGNNENSRNAPTRILSSMMKYTKKDDSPESRLDDLLRQLNVEKIKFTTLNNIISFFKETNGEVFESAIPQLVNLIHSAYQEQIKECIKVIASTEGGVAFSSFLDAVVDYMTANTNLKSIDFLCNVVKYYKSRDLSPRVQQILEKVKPYLEDSYAPARKSATFLMVELRLSIGKAFDGEINKLPNVSKKMVFFYLSKKQSNC